MHPGQGGKIVMMTYHKYKRLKRLWCHPLLVAKRGCVLKDMERTMERGKRNIVVSLGENNKLSLDVAKVCGNHKHVKKSG